MIGSIRGRIAGKQAPHIIVDCAGVGYEIETPMSTFLDLPGTGDEVFLFTHLQVREDAQTLYGFATAAEKQLFRTLLRVNGVGAKMGLAILSGMTVEGFARCVQHEDTAMLQRFKNKGVQYVLAHTVQPPVATMLKSAQSLGLAARNLINRRRIAGRPSARSHP